MKEIRRRADLMVKMRDGVRIAVDVYMPERKGRYPAIFAMAPYPKERQELEGGFFSDVEAMNWRYIVPRGYACVVANSRGSGASDGSWNFMDAVEQKDGYELVEWIAAQPWCDGSVAMMGNSYYGMIQPVVAETKPPHLRAIVIFNGLSDTYRDMTHPGGVLSDGFMSRWALSVFQRCLRRPHKGKVRPANFLLDVVDHSTDGPYYRERSARHRLGSIKIPVLDIVVAHQPNHSRTQIDGFEGIGSKQKRLVIWSSELGSWRLFYSDEANEMMLAWLDHFLKGVENGAEREPRVSVSLFGSNRWLHGDAYPLRGTKWTSLFLDEGALRSGPPGSETSGTFRYPESHDLVQRSNRSPLEYFSEPLAEDMDVAGPVSLTLFGSTSADDVSWMVALLDVAPGGERTKVVRGWLRGALREVDESRSGPGRPYHPFRKLTFLVPGEVYRFDIELIPAFRTFMAGHRIGLGIAVSEDSRWERYPHQSVEEPCVVSVLHGPEHPSHLVLPVVEKR